MMDHSFMQNRRATTSVFSIESAAASWKVFKDEEDEEEDTVEEEEEEIEEVEEMISSRAKKKRLMHLGGGSTTTVGKKVWTTSTAAVAGGVVAARNPLPAGGCQVEKCVADLTDSKRYHQRHKVCEYHSKAQVVIVCGLTQRFCQQCSRFHELSEFDDAKRSCRRRLAGHNERRRKHFSSESHGEASASASATAATGRRGSASGSGSQMDKKQCRQADDRGRNQIAV